MAWWCMAWWGMARWCVVRGAWRGVHGVVGHGEVVRSEGCMARGCEEYYIGNEPQQHDTTLLLRDWKGRD